MSDEGDKTCPLCAEEMDLTDLQLKPCKCGYEICVWCWHHIMDMAEKDETQGRCPACRTPYNKEKIVGTAVKCGKLVTELNVEKKLKSQKGKGKTMDGRKQLESVRVIQRNLVYVVGLPLNYADEDILLRKDYFSQYGKVLKVSISRTGAIQQFANSTCSVYITYSKEEEAVRCIQSVHGFVLDGKSLRACFGTTKYCHAWLRNVPCNNKDCLYLHEIGSQEDSYTKDEIISAYTRNRVEQITGSSNITQQRAGNVLPPPGDEYCNNSSTSGKPITKAVINTNNVTSVARVSPPNSSAGRSALPAGASWGTRPANNSQPSSTSTAYFNAPPNQKPDISNGPVAISKKSSRTSQESSLQSDVGKKKVQNQENIMTREKIKNTSGLKEKNSNANCGIHISNGPVASVDPVNFPSTRQPSSPSKTKLPPDFSNIFDCSVFSTGPMPDNKSIIKTDGSIESVCSSILSMSIHENRPALNGYVEPNKDPLIRQMSAKAAKTIDDRCGAHVQSEFGHGIQSNLTQVDWHEREDDVLFIDNQRVNGPEVATSRVQEFTDVMNLSKHFSTHSHELSNAGRSIGIAFDRQVVDRNVKFVVPTLNLPHERSENLLINSEGNDAGHSNLFPSNERRYLLGRYEGEASSSGVDMGESNIISNILSMDFDPWNESFSTSQNLAKLLGETDKRERSFGVSGAWKNHNSNQSRFSFAREGEIMNQSGQSNGYVEQGFKQHPFGPDISSRDSLYLGRSESRNGLPVFGGTVSDNFASSSHFHIPSNKPYASKSHISTPPGFSAPNRAPPPPGFASHERTEPFFEPISGNHMHDASSPLLRNPYQTPSNTNAFSNGDIGFMDPAILAVGKGTLPAGGINNPGLDMKSNFPLQLNMYEDTRFQSLLQRSLLPHQNQRVNNDLGDCFSTLVDAYGLPSRIADQTLSNNQLPFSQFNLPLLRNGISPNGSNSRMVDLLRNERLGLNKSYGGYEDSDIQNPSSGNLYHRTYGI